MRKKKQKTVKHPKAKDKSVPRGDYLRMADGMRFTPREFWEGLLTQRVQMLVAEMDDDKCSTLAHEYAEVPGSAYMLVLRGELRDENESFKGSLRIEFPKAAKAVPDLLKRAAEIVNLPEETPEDDLRTEEGHR